MRNRAPPPDPPLYATEGRESTLYPLNPTFLTRSILSQYCDRMVLCSCNTHRSLTVAALIGAASVRERCVLQEHNTMRSQYWERIDRVRKVGFNGYSVDSLPSVA